MTREIAILAYAEMIANQDYNSPYTDLFTSDKIGLDGKFTPIELEALSYIKRHWTGDADLRQWIMDIDLISGDEAAYKSWRAAALSISEPVSASEHSSKHDRRLERDG